MSPLESLSLLDLTGCPVRSLEGLVPLRRLNLLQLSRTAVEDKGLRPLWGLFSLGSLELSVLHVEGLGSVGEGT